VGNETNDAADSKWVIEEDTTRLVHARKAEETGDYVDHDHTNLDMENLLRVTIRGYFDDENSPADRDLEPEDGQWCSTEEWQYQRAMIEGGSVRGSLKKNVVHWLYEDHGADREYRNSPLKHVNYKGWVDLYRIPKYIYYLTQAIYTSDPMVFIHPHFWTPKYLGETREFIVNSNCDRVELFVNGDKVGEAAPDYENYYTVTFRDIQVVEGILKAVGTKDGKKVEHSVAMSGEPSGLKLTISHDQITAGKSGMAIVTADIVDSDGNRVIHARNPLHWSVEGAATLIGPAVYQSDYDLFESMEGSGYIHPPVSNIIRSANQPGNATITVSSPGLDPASVRVKVVPARMDARGIEQPVLSDQGRQKITRIEGDQFEIRAVDELRPISGNRTFDISDREKLVNEFTGYIQDNSPDFDEDLLESSVLLDWFTGYLVRMNGELIGDDFNFMADKYNDLRLISMAIDQSNIWYNLTTLLIQDYADRIINKGELVDAEEAARLFMKLPGERTILKREEARARNGDPWIPEAWQMEPVYCYFTDFESLIALVYPGYTELDETQRSLYREFVSAINPELKIRNGRLSYSEDALFCLPDPERVVN
jgi:hypothetical protein